MNYETIVVEQEAELERLDKFLSEEYENLSRSYLQKLISSGNILVNAKQEKANYKLKSGDQITVEIPEITETSILPEKMDLDVVYEDPEVIVVNKRKGIVVHPAPGNYSGTLVNGLLAHCKDLSGINGVLRPGIVHRIDKDTSGLVIACKNDSSHQFLAEQFKNHTIERAYYALVYGIVQEPLGRIEAPIGRSEKDRKKMAVTFKNSREAVTNYKVLERFAKGYTLLECRLETGRTHQIRVHMAYLGHPLVGDFTYGMKRDALGVVGQALHAYKLGFVHPLSQEKVVLETPLPEDMAALLNQLREEN